MKLIRVSHAARSPSAWELVFLLVQQPAAPLQPHPHRRYSPLILMAVHPVKHWMCTVRPLLLPSHCLHPSHLSILLPLTSSGKKGKRA